jgi:DNA-binding NarL/FixJ family response regulator
MSVQCGVLPLVSEGQPIQYVVIDDEPRYRNGLGAQADPLLEQVGSYADVDTFLVVQLQSCHVVVLDLCLNRQTDDAAVLQGVLAIRQLSSLGHRVVVHTADVRPEPVARCVAAGAVGYISKYSADVTKLAQAVAEVARHGYVSSPMLTADLRQLMRKRLNPDERLSGTVEETLVLLDRGLSDNEIAGIRHLSPKTIEDHKAKILQTFGDYMKVRRVGFAGLARDLGIGPGDLVNDPAATRPKHKIIGPVISGLLRRGDPLRRRT